MTPTLSIDAYRTLLDALTTAPVESRFVTVWNARGGGDEETVTFGEYLERAAGYAALYRASGVRARDTIVLVMDQSTALLAAFAGALLIDAVPAILAYPTFKVDPEKYRDGLAGVTRNLGARLLIIDDAFPPDLERHLAGQAVLRLPAAPPSARVDASTLPAPRPDDVAFIQHSAGTTGLQKGVAEVDRGGKFEGTLEYRLRAGFGGGHAQG